MLFNLAKGERATEFQKNYGKLSAWAIGLEGEKGFEGASRVTLTSLDPTGTPTRQENEGRNKRDFSVA